MVKTSLLTWGHKMHAGVNLTILGHPQSSPAISSLQRGLTGHGLSTGRTYRVVHPVGSWERVHMISCGLRDLGIWLFLVSLTGSGLLAGGQKLTAKEEFAESGRSFGETRTVTGDIERALARATCSCAR
jgi:hypothetical protein